MLPELLADIFQLGSWPSRIADLLAGADLPPNSKLIELGCGKGEVMIEVAKRLSRRITGVDAFPPFLLEAREAAERAAQIIARAPELRETVEGYVRAEEEECRFMEANTEAALFLLQKK